jgi:NAD(P)H-dependent FMN reductase
MATRVLVFAGSTRSGALSARLAALAAKELALADAAVTLISLADYPLPVFDGDREADEGIPENATKLARMIAATQGVFIATPEYNHSLPPLLKNAIDWVSRHRNTGSLSYRRRIYAVGSTSDGAIGGARALLDLRKVLMAGLGAIMLPDKIEIPRAQDAFDDSGQLIDEGRAKLMKTVCQNLVDFASRLMD